MPSDFALPQVASRQVTKASGSLSSASVLTDGRMEPVAPHSEALTAMNSKYVRKPYYEDGWKIGGKNMWIEERLGGNWMNITSLKEYTFASGRLKPRVLTKLRMADHKRATRYIKRLRMLGLMPYHRLLAKIETDPEAKRPQRVTMPTQGQAARSSERISKEVNKM